MTNVICGTRRKLTSGFTKAIKPKVLTVGAVADMADIAVNAEQPIDNLIAWEEVPENHPDVIEAMDTEQHFTPEDYEASLERFCEADDGYETGYIQFEASDDSLVSENCKPLFPTVDFIEPSTMDLLPSRHPNHPRGKFIVEAVMCSGRGRLIGQREATHHLRQQTRHIMRAI